SRKRGPIDHLSARGGTKALQHDGADAGGIAEGRLDPDDADTRDLPKVRRATAERWAVVVGVRAAERDRLSCGRARKPAQRDDPEPWGAFLSHHTNCRPLRRRLRRADVA